MEDNMNQIEIRTEDIEKIHERYIAIDGDPDEIRDMTSMHFLTPEVIIYNGVAGIFESRYGMKCTKNIIYAIRNAKIRNDNISAIALGGEGVSAAIRTLGEAEAARVFTHLSTAGGAGLELWTNENGFTALNSFPSRSNGNEIAGYNNLMTIRDIRLELKNKIVSIIADLNLEEPDPNDIKVKALIEDIEFAKKCNARKIILISHRGRPDGKEDQYSMRIYCKIYTEILHERNIIEDGKEVRFIDDCIGESCRKAISDLPDGSICITENTRFHVEEKSKDKDILKSFAMEVKNATGTEVLIFSAAGSAHRKDATKKYLPELIEKKAIGILMQKEINAISRLRDKNNGPVLAILQGAKSDKLEIIKAIFENNMVDRMIVLGKLALYFYNGNETASEIRKIAGNKLILPKRMTIAKIPECMSEKDFINHLKTQK